MEIKFSENGPIILDTRDRVSFTSGESSEEKEGPIYLCRCGQSSNKPFCDGTHRKIDFKAPAAHISCP